MLDAATAGLGARSFTLPLFVAEVERSHVIINAEYAEIFLKEFGVGEKYYKP